MNKKILAILMALLMVLMSSVAFAEGEGSTTVPADAKTVSITKNYTGTDKPEQTFTFKATALASKTNEGDIAADDVPAIGNATVTIGADNTATTTFALPNYDLPGIYNYTLTEVPGNTAGVSYNPENASYDLKVTVISSVDAQGNTTLTRIVALRPAGQTSQESKLATATFNNTYTADTKGLSVTKVLAGNYADTRDKFVIQVTFTAATDTTLASAIKVNAPASVKVTNEGYVYTLTDIGHNDTVTFTNIPAGVTWYVNETDNTGSQTGGTYEAKYSDTDQTGTIGTDSEITVTNERNTELDTGVFTDSMPYFMLLAFVMILAAAVVLKKRTVNE